MLNQIVVSGNLGADPEMFFTTDGNPIASFSIAFKHSRDKSAWIKVSCFGKTAEVAEKFLHKGARVAVVGSLIQNKWETDNGETKSSFQINANTIEFIKTDGRGFEENQNNNNEHTQAS